MFSANNLTTQSITVQGNGPSYRFAEMVGSGTDGFVYKAYPIVNGQVKYEENGRSTVVAIKAIPIGVRTKKDIEYECKAARKIYPKSNVIFLEKSAIGFIVTDFIEGRAINNYTDEAIAKLNLFQKLQLIKNIAIQIRLLHVAGIIHGDTKITNFIFGKDRVFPIDFSWSSFLSGYDPKTIRKNKWGLTGSTDYFPVETLHGCFGQKTDIYMAVAMFAGILGVAYPLCHKMLTQDAMEPYEVNTILPFPHALHRQLTIRFLNRMQHNEYAKRPDADEVVRFFSILEQIHDPRLNSRKGPELAKYKKAQTTQLLLLAVGRQETVNDKNIEKLYSELCMTFRSAEEKNRATVQARVKLYHERVSNSEAAGYLEQKKWKELSEFLTKDKTPKITDKQLLAAINKNREAIVDACVANLNALPVNERAKKIIKIKEGQNALGAIIKQPRSPFLFKLSFEEYTTSMRKILFTMHPKSKSERPGCCPRFC